MLFYSRHDLHLQWKKIKLIDVLLSSRHQHNQTRKEENNTELNLTLGLAFRLSECLCSQLQMQVTITMEQTCDGIGCRIADGRSGLWHESYSPTPPAAMLMLLGALDESAVREARRTRKGDGRWAACRAMPAAMAMAEKLKHHCVSWGFHFVRAPIELEGHRSVKLLLIWASFSTEWAANSKN